jgi:hypothetical protein
VRSSTPPRDSADARQIKSAHDLAEQEARALHQRRTQPEIGAAADTLELSQRTEEEA